MRLEHLLSCFAFWIPLLIAGALIVCPARLWLPSDERQTFTKFVERYPRYLLYIRELVFLILIPVSIVGTVFLTHRWGQMGVYLTGGIAFAVLNCIISLLEMVTGVSILSGYGGRFLRSQRFIRSPQVRRVALIRLSLSLLFIAVLAFVARLAQAHS